MRISAWFPGNPVTIAVLVVVCAVAGASLPSQAPDSVSTSAGSIRLEKLTTLEQPWGLAYLPDGRLLITEKPGRLRIWANGRLSEPVRGVPKVVFRNPSDQGGLMDVEADPNFNQNRMIYLSYSEAAEPQPPDLIDTGDHRFGGVDVADNILRGAAVARGRLEGEEVRDLQVIWRQFPKTVGRGHFGVRIVFAPDGKLFLTSGDRMRFDPAQSMASNLGKVVRINPDGSIPSDNPFVNREGARGDIYSAGHRNILSAAINPSDGRLWVVEMGPRGGDELNLIQAGKNYGWPLVCDGDNYAGPMIPDHATRRDLEAPVRSWTPVISPSGAMFYTGSMFSGWKGSALVGGLSSQAIIRLTFSGDQVAIEERIAMRRRIRDLIQAPDGAILALIDARSADLLRLTPAKQ